ncbi:MAG: hypothetical protein GC166_12725 [Alphaproteobacteria bacterium]|nr:hypothetical protein [Alphaproteobacteria bacterium]
MAALSGIYEFSLGGLSTEMTMLSLAMILGFVHLFAQSQTMTAERGRAWNTGPRDSAEPFKGKIAGRLDRAFANFRETFPFFAASVLALAVLGRHNWYTVWGAEMYLVARLIYLPLYAIGVPGLRTLVWAVGSLGIAFLIGAMLGAGG